MFNPGLPDLGPAVGSFVGGILDNQLDPQLSYMWEVRVESMDSVRGFERAMQLFARTITIPPRSVDEMNRMFMGKKISDPGFEVSQNQFRAVFWDDKRMIGYRYFTDWFNITADPEYGRQVKSSKLRRNIIIRLKDRSDFFLGLEIELKGAYIFNIGEVNMSYEESTPFIYSVGLHFDKMILNGTEYSNTGATPANALDITSKINNKIKAVKENIKGRVSARFGG